MSLNPLRSPRYSKLSMVGSSLAGHHSYLFGAAIETRRARDLERGLMDYVSRFLLDLGEGFAFVGRQVRKE
jgi:hypothetical protein